MSQISNKATRKRLPDNRASITHKFTIADKKGYITVDMYEDGNPGAIFIRFAKTGGQSGALLDAWATMVSICLQLGVSLETITEKFKAWSFEPSGITSNPNIRFVTSPLDYVCRWLSLKFKKE